MDLRLKDRIACVSGASRGIGRAIAAGLAAEGTHLALCARNAEPLTETAHELREQFGVRVSVKALDVRDPAALRSWIAETDQLYGRVDICVCNAGGPPAKPFVETTDAEWQAAFETNLQSSIVLTQAVLPLMKERRRGRIVMLSSMAVRQPLPQLVFSNTLRSGLLGFIRTVSNEMAQYGITINNVAPGYTATERLKTLAEYLSRQEGRSAAEIEAGWTRDIPAGRLGTPEEIAAAVVWLASEQASFITGQTLVVDGGMYKGI